MEKKNQRYNIVIQENNESYNTIEKDIKNIPCLFYALAKHEADEEHDNNHYHLVIDFGKNRGKTFEEIHELFKDCHEEPTINLKKSVAYLTHEDESSKEQKKKIYNRNQILTNDRVLYNALANGGSLETLDLTMLELYIEQGTNTYVRFCQRFGVESCQPYMASIKDYLCHFDSIERIKTNNEALAKIDLVYQYVNGLYMSDHEKVEKISQLFLTSD